MSGYGPCQQDERGCNLSVIDHSITQVVPYVVPALVPLCGRLWWFCPPQSEYVAGIFWQEMTGCYEEWEWPSTLVEADTREEERPGMVDCRAPILTSAASVHDFPEVWELGRCLAPWYMFTKYPTIRIFFICSTCIPDCLSDIPFLSEMVKHSLLLLSRLR